jgi:hypothetical protein
LAPDIKGGTSTGDVREQVAEKKFRKKSMKWREGGESCMTRSFVISLFAKYN